MWEEGRADLFLFPLLYVVVPGEGHVGVTGAEEVLLGGEVGGRLWRAHDGAQVGDREGEFEKHLFLLFIEAGDWWEIAVNVGDGPSLEDMATMVEMSLPPKNGWLLVCVTSLQRTSAVTLQSFW